MRKLTKRLRNDINTTIIPILRAFESEYVNDAYAETLSEAFDNLRKGYQNLNLAKSAADDFVSSANNSNKQRFYKAMENAVGVNVETIVQNEGLEDILVASTRENVGLIKSIPDEYFKKIETAVFTGTTQGSKVGSMIKEIQKINKVTDNRAKVIARDQSSKINSALTQQRSQNLGVTEYIWRTVGDERTRQTHKNNNGKVFRWDKPSKITGHPGQDVQCRCVAQPIINV